MRPKSPPRQVGHPAQVLPVLFLLSIPGRKPLCDQVTTGSSTCSLLPTTATRTAGAPGPANQGCSSGPTTAPKPSLPRARLPKAWLHGNPRAQPCPVCLPCSGTATALQEPASHLRAMSPRRTVVTDLAVGQQNRSHTPPEEEALSEAEARRPSQLCYLRDTARTPPLQDSQQRRESSQPCGLQTPARPVPADSATLTVPPSTGSGAPSTDGAAKVWGCRGNGGGAGCLLVGQPPRHLAGKDYGVRRGVSPELSSGRGRKCPRKRCCLRVCTCTGV